MDGHKQAVHMEDGQGVDEHIPLACRPTGCRPAPVILERECIAQQIAMCEHGPLAAAGGAAGVKDGGQVIGQSRYGGVLVAVLSCTVEQAAGAVVIQGEHMLGACLEGDLADPAKIGPTAHHHSRLGVANEILNLSALVGGVEWQKHAACAQASQVQHHGFDRFFDLHGHPTALG